MIYFIKSAGGNTVKIGFTDDDPQKRLSQLQIGHDGALELLGVIDGNVDREEELHEHFAEFRRRGEWFWLVPRLQKFIQRAMNKDEVKTNSRAVRVGSYRVPSELAKKLRLEAVEEFTEIENRAEQKLKVAVTSLLRERELTIHEIGIALGVHTKTAKFRRVFRSLPVYVTNKVNRISEQKWTLKGAQECLSENTSAVAATPAAK